MLSFILCPPVYPSSPSLPVRVAQDQNSAVSHPAQEEEFFHVPCAVGTELRKARACQAAQPCGLGGTSYKALRVFSNGRARE